MKHIPGEIPQTPAEELARDEWLDDLWEYRDKLREEDLNGDSNDSN